MTDPSLINVAAFGFALLILWRAEPALARMVGGTHWMVRYAMLLLAGGALGLLAGIYYGFVTVDFFTLLVLAGIALLLFCDRRLKVLVRHRHPGDRHA
jgi:hypothetical protein